LNGQVAVATDEPLVGAFVNFVTGAVALSVALVFAYATGSTWSALPAPWDEPVLWLGGVLGLAFILGTTIVVGPLGVLLLSLLVTAGSLVGALVSDLLAPVPGVGVSVTLILGVVLTGLSAGYAAGRSRRPAGVGR
jgi:transporter family-2 protein